MTATDRLWCVVPAAGRGTRFGVGVRKQHAPLAGGTVLECTLLRLAGSGHVAGIVLVLAAEDREAWRTPDAVAIPVVTAAGGTVRSRSVRAGLAGLPDEVRPGDFVLVHDAARPCIAASDIARLIAEGAPAGGAVLAARVRDTVKRAGADQRIVTTEPRDGLWRALTPQMFRRGELTDALERAFADGIEVTDEAMAMERVGHHPLLVEGRDDNIKVTTAADLELAADVLVRERTRADPGNRTSVVE
ncbi:MAG: 2-C-methyl-D-erythritol 4-phosphate cytidylyltransferase [Lysobacterales bacterium]